MKLQSNKSGVSSVLLKVLVVVFCAPYVWNYLVQSSVVVNIAVSVVILTIIGHDLANQAFRSAISFFQEYQTRPTK